MMCSCSYGIKPAKLKRGLMLSKCSNKLRSQWSYLIVDFAAFSRSQCKLSSISNRAEHKKAP